MQFNTYIFILLFLPISLIGYWVTAKINKTANKIWLILTSAIFYVYAGWKLALILGASIVVNYIFAIVLSKFRRNLDYSLKLLVKSVIKYLIEKFNATKSL